MTSLALRYLETLRQTQYLPPEDLLAYQMRLLERLCRHAALETEFNRERLRLLFAGGDAANGAFRFENWPLVPLFDRAAAQANREALIAENVPDAVGPTSSGSTSGSTGRPFHFLTSQYVHVAGLANTARIYENFGLNPAKAFGWMKSDIQQDSAPPLGLVSKGWSVLSPDGPHYALSANSTVAQCIDWLRLRRPDYLFTYPSIVVAIARQLQREGARNIALSAILTAGENVDENMPELVQDVFGARHIDIYGTLEIGPIASQCPTGTHKHIAAESVFIEILREDGTLAKPGEKGRIVATPLYNYAMPMVRYDMGDFGVQGPVGCGCGSTLPRLEKVLGRTRNIFRFVDGSQRHPRGFSVFLNYLSFTQIQVVQTALDHIEVRWVRDPARHIHDEAGLVAFLRQTMHPDIRVTLKEVTNLPRAASGKFEDFLSLVG